MKSNSLVPVLAISLLACLKTEAQVLHDVFIRYAQVPQYSISIYQSESQYPYSGNSSGIIFSLLSFEDVLYETNELADVQDGYYLRYNGATLDGASSWYVVEYDAPFTRTNFDSYHSYYPIGWDWNYFYIECSNSRSGSGWALIENNPAGLVLINSSPNVRIFPQIPEPSHYPVILGLVSYIIVLGRRKFRT